jgi:polygalacturonase
MSYCIFENPFNGPVNIRVKKLSGSFSTATIRPSTYGIATTQNASNTIQFTLPSYENRKVSLEFDGDRQHNHFIYGYKPDSGKPTASSATVKYYGPGIWNEGTITLNAGQTLYIDYGAIVYANVITYGSNVTIAGHGILCGSKMKHWGDDSYSWGDFLIRSNKSNADATNLTIKDITMIDSPGWNLCVSKTDGVHIDGVNMISWELNGDGIDIVSCKNVEINNCFIRTYDDCISLKCRFIVDPITDVTGVKIHDCLIWNDYARGIVVGPEAGNLTSTGYIHDVNVYDCIFLQNARAFSDDLRAAFAIGQGSDGSSNLWSGSATPRPITDITASNLTFDNIAKTGRAVSIRQFGGTTKVNMSRIKLNNIKVIDNSGNLYPAFNIVTNGSTISGLTISNFTVNDNKVTSTGTQFKIDYPSNVEYTIE